MMGKIEKDTIGFSFKMSEDWIRIVDWFVEKGCYPNRNKAILAAIEAFLPEAETREPLKLQHVSLKGPVEIKERLTSIMKNKSFCFMSDIIREAVKKSFGDGPIP